MKNHAPPHSLHIASGDLWAGAEVQLYTLTRALKLELNVPVTVILLNHGMLESRLRESGIDVTVIDESGTSSLVILRHLVNTIRKLQPDIIHTHRTKENIIGGIAARVCGIPSLRTLHGAPEHYPDWWNIPKHLVRTLDWFSGRFLQCRVIAVTDDLASSLQNKYPAKKLRVIENGIDEDVINKDTSHQHHASLNKTPFRVGIAGRLVPVKRVDLFIESARYMRDHHPDLDVSYHIFGDGPLREQLQALNKSLGTETIVHFEGHRDDMYRQIQSVDIILMTSDHEGLPMILLEAMALGTPVIAHAVGGIPKLLNQGQCGILVNNHSASGYAQATYSLLEAPDILESLAINSKERVREHYSATRNAEQYLSAYYECLS